MYSYLRCVEFIVYMKAMYEDEATSLLSKKNYEYREKILSLINDNNRYQHVSILDSDRMVNSIMKNAVESHLI